MIREKMAKTLLIGENCGLKKQIFLIKKKIWAETW